MFVVDLSKASFRCVGESFESVGVVDEVVPDEEDFFGLRDPDETCKASCERFDWRSFALRFLNQT